MPLPARPADLRFDVPAQSSRARLAGRCAAAAVADATDPHVDHDVRLTVEELAHVLVGAASPIARLHVRVWVHAATVVVEGRVVASDPGVVPVLSELSSTLLNTLTRSHSLVVHGDQLVFRLSTLAAGKGRSTLPPRPPPSTGDA